MPTPRPERARSRSRPPMRQEMRPRRRARSRSTRRPRHHRRAPGGGGTHGTSPTFTAAPRVLNRRFRVGGQRTVAVGRAAAARKRVKVGTMFTYALDRAATVTITLARPRSARPVTLIRASHAGRKPDRVQRAAGQARAAPGALPRDIHRARRLRRCKQGRDGRVHRGQGLKRGQARGPARVPIPLATPRRTAWPPESVSPTAGHCQCSDGRQRPDRPDRTQTPAACVGTGGKVRAQSSVWSEGQ